MSRLTLCGEKELIALVKLRDRLVAAHADIKRQIIDKTCCQFYRQHIYKERVIELTRIIDEYLKEKENENI